MRQELKDAIAINAPTAPQLHKLVGDTPIKLMTVADMTNDQLDTFIMEARERRMLSVRMYDHECTIIKQFDADKIKARLTKHLEMFQKEVDSYDRLYLKMAKRIGEIQSSRMELEMLYGNPARLGTPNAQNTEASAE